MKQLLQFVLVLFSSFYFSQDYYNLIDITNKHRETGDIENAIKLNSGYLKKYLEKDDTKGIATAYINIGGLFFARNDYNESLIYLEKAKKYVEKVDDPLIKSRFYLAYGRNYSSLKLFRESNENLNKAIYFAKKSSNADRKEKFIFLEIYGNGKILKV
ncbi:tetratricopeptide repeat protein [Chryseobacterium sp. MMS23-Vi53]|uniref:tetratricopeptide repeat protein n=1 Tax=Chryseobacterium sp. MMS23-Vi53 TaxID=3386644 RepID=UPI0039E7EFF1